MLINRFSIALFIFSLLVISQTPITDANSSGKHNSSNGCSCHSNSGNQPTINHNFPNSYTAGQTYSVTISLSTSGSGGFSATIDHGTFTNAGPSTSIVVQVLHSALVPHPGLLIGLHQAIQGLELPSGWLDYRQWKWKLLEILGARHLPVYRKPACK